MLRQGENLRSNTKIFRDNGTMVKISVIDISKKRIQCVFRFFLLNLSEPHRDSVATPTAVGEKGNSTAYFHHHRIEPITIAWCTPAAYECYLVHHPLTVYPYNSILEIKYTIFSFFFLVFFLLANVLLFSVRRSTVDSPV